MSTACLHCPSCSEPVLDPAHFQCMSCGAALPVSPPSGEVGESSVVPDLIEAALDLLPDLGDLF